MSLQLEGSESERAKSGLFRRSFLSRRLLLKSALASGLSSRQGSAQEATPTVPSFINPTPDPEARDFGPVIATESYRLAALIPFPNDPFWISVKSAIEIQADENGISVEFFELEPANPSVPDQIGQIELVIANGFQGILIGLVDAAAMAPGLIMANDRSVPVIALDTPPVAGEVISVIRTDNEAAAALAGQYIGVELDGKGTVLNIQGNLDDTVAQDRDRGFKTGLEEFPDIKIKSVEDNWNASSSWFYVNYELPFSDDETPIPLEPLINAVFAAGPNMALDSATAIEQVKADSVFVVGFGVNTEVEEAIRNGTMRAAVSEFPERVGRIGVNLMVAYLNGDEVPAQVDSGFTLVTRDTLDAFQ